MQFKKNYRISGKIACLTGLHIGGSNDVLGIGGTDAPVIYDRIENIPIIPGSSLKGKMRSSLELKYTDRWLEKDGKPHTCDAGDCDLCIAFGRGAKDAPTEGSETGPTRLIVRDAFPDKQTRGLWEGKEGIVHGTEIKGENFLNRINSVAKPRFIERVPAGSAFDFEMIFSVYGEEDEKRLAYIFEALTLVEDTYLGKAGSRGYGKVAFQEISVAWKSPESYRAGEGWKADERFAAATTPGAILKVLNGNRA
jgi:CRISPR-associated protein Csm3